MFIYSEKATKFDEISIFCFDIAYLINIKNKMEISSNCLALSEYMNFIYLILFCLVHWRLNK